MIPLQILRFSFMACVFCGVSLLLALLIGRAMPTDRLVFLSDSDSITKLYAIDIHRGLTHKVNDTELSFYALSPDGGQILYIQEVNYQSTIFIMSLNGSEAHQLVDLPGISPAWSPDSRFIAFTMLGGQHKASQIYRVKSDGSDLKPLTELSADENPFSPLWSPDGTRILFQSMSAGNKPNAYFMNGDGSDLHQVSYPEDFEFFAASPRWSPDSRYLAFVGQSIDKKDQTLENILCLLELASDDLHCLADDIFSGFAWSPDSKFIAYVVSKGYGIFKLEILNS